MTNYFSVLDWKITLTEEPVMLQSMGGHWTLLSKREHPTMYHHQFSSVQSLSRD